jgi:hypothetical protein
MTNLQRVYERDYNAKPIINFKNESHCDTCIDFSHSKGAAN